jgi:hypothetical protein
LGFGISLSDSPSLFVLTSASAYRSQTCVEGLSKAFNAQRLRLLACHAHATCKSPTTHSQIGETTATQPRKIPSSLPLTSHFWCGFGFRLSPQTELARAGVCNCAGLTSSLCERACARTAHNFSFTASPVHLRGKMVAAKAPFSPRLSQPGCLKNYFFNICTFAFHLLPPYS